MPIQFIPDPGTVLICDYTTGFVPPEMVKPRRVVVISPKFLNNRGICTVVPLSTSAPDPELPIHVRFEAGSYAFLSRDVACWAKCDLQAAVALKRLDRLRLGSHFHAPRISREDLQRIREAVLYMIGMHPQH
jgi:uncharacterized protein YifN (PemK superfamily)